MPYPQQSVIGAKCAKETPLLLVGTARRGFPDAVASKTLACCVCGPMLGCWDARARLRAATNLLWL